MSILGRLFDKILNRNQGGNANAAPAQQSTTTAQANTGGVAAQAQAPQAPQP